MDGRDKIVGTYEKELNNLAAKRIPFLFVTDFLQLRPKVFPLSEVEGNDSLLYKVGSFTNASPIQSNPSYSSITPHILTKHPISFERYAQGFHYVLNQLKKGNSFLVNLTYPTPITLNTSLKDIFYISEAPYKLWLKEAEEEFVLFSPEPFIHIHQGIIYAYPMKGTIEASLPHAKRQILENPKEFAEHVTIVDLIRNDLSMFARKVAVEKFRYVEEIHNASGNLLQVSSKIRGELGGLYPNQLGTILLKMLPAGSISGAPKTETLNIIAEAEGYDRGYYTGVFGIFDGENVYSSVMIRFIQKIGNQYVYKSGGGITARSICKKEYEEMIQKIYVPTTRKPQYHPISHPESFLP